MNPILHLYVFSCCLAAFKSSRDIFSFSTTCRHTVQSQEATVCVTAQIISQQEAAMIKNKKGGSSDADGIQTVSVVRRHAARCKQLNRFEI